MSGRTGRGVQAPPDRLRLGFVFELSQAQVARAIDLLRTGPVRADVFATRMWPDRQYKSGDAGRAGHLILRRLGALGLVEKVGDMWVTRSFSQSIQGATQVRTQETLGVALGNPLGEPLREGLQEPLREPSGEPPRDGHREVQADRLRLGQLVSLADNPVAGVTHDAVYGNVRVRGHFVDDCLAEACAFAVLRGRSLNIYPPLGNALVGLSPIEGGRALYLRWRQSGQPPEPPYRGGTGWIFLDDGIATAPNCWKPAGADRQWMEEPCLERIARQRAEAGLGPPVGNGGSR